MAEATVGRWGRNLAVRMPSEIARAAEPSEGERVEIEIRDGDIVIRRPAARTRADAEAAAEEIIDESRTHSLGRVTIRELFDEGRRG
ncbi:MAG TPA: AbrB/MazE/SpoVT family DNA-binding domain-containing protein [Stellaceae bacterium]|nr:AbrB/MazE/SpoVT family DNA-binding domain-containing protein [Stellaceae bacterium]